MSMSMSTQNARAGPRQFGRRPAAAGSTRVAIAAPTTPHAIRAMEERRRVRMTPSREKRRASGRGAERGSPMDILRALAGVISVPKMGLFAGGGDEEEEEGEGEEEEDDEEELRSMDESEESDGIAKPPRLSLPMNEMRPDGDDDDEDDTGIFRPPEISRIDDEDLTVKSVEFARRAEVDASMVLGGGRRRDSDFFDPLDFGRGFEMGQNQSPSFVIGDQTLFAGVDAG